MKRVLIMGGGTGGHVFPGLALARYLEKHQVEVHWLGTQKGMEAKLVPEASIPLHLINITGIRGKNKLTLLFAPYKIAVAIWQSLAIIRRLQPDVVVGMGGFVSGPGGIASWLSRIPLIVHEQNAVAGTTNKILAHFAKKVLTGFPNAFKQQPHIVTVGNPVRVEIEALLSPSLRAKEERQPLAILGEHDGLGVSTRMARRAPPSCALLRADTPSPSCSPKMAEQPLHLLILGGSLGAKKLNELVPKALSLLSEAERPMIVHQTGESSVEEVKKDYESRGIEAIVVPFVKDMAAMYSWADMVLCRAGALTVSEICVAGMCAVFVPFPFAIDDHQTANAAYLVNHQAALSIQQKDLTETGLADIVREFARTPEKRLAMAESAYQLRRVNVVQNIYEICREVCH